MIQLIFAVFLRPALFKRRVGGFCEGLAFLRPCNDHIPFKLAEGEENRSDQLALRGVVHTAHIKNVDDDASVHQSVYYFQTIYCGSGDPVQLADNQFVIRLEFSEQLVPFRPAGLCPGISIGVDS